MTPAGGSEGFDDDHRLIVDLSGSLREIGHCSEDSVANIGRMPWRRHLQRSFQSLLAELLAMGLMGIGDPVRDEEEHISALIVYRAQLQFRVEDLA